MENSTLLSICWFLRAVNMYLLTDNVDIPNAVWLRHLDLYFHIFLIIRHSASDPKYFCTAPGFLPLFLLLCYHCNKHLLATAGLSWCQNDYCSSLGRVSQVVQDLLMLSQKEVTRENDNKTNKQKNHSEVFFPLGELWFRETRWALGWKSVREITRKRAMVFKPEFFLSK